MAKKLTRLQKEYQKELTRLRKGMSYWKNKGYFLNDMPFERSPKRVTQKLLKEIKQTKPKSLTKYAEQVDLETGEIISSPSTKPAPKKQKTIAPKQVETPAPAPATTPDITSTEEYIPNLSIIDEIKARIASMPDRNRARKDGIPIAARRNGLLEIFEDTLNSLEDSELPNYIEYLLEHQSELFSSLTHIEYESKDEKIEASFAQAGRILNNGDSLTPMQSETLDVMQEYI